MYRATMEDTRLSSLARLAIETDLLRSIDFDTIIKQFAEKKSRKKLFKWKLNEKKIYLYYIYYLMLFIKHS